MPEPIIIDLWVFALDTDAKSYERMVEHLSDQERARANRFISDVHQRQFRIGRGRMREILANYTGFKPANLVFEYGAHDKPELLGGGLHFNLSHTGSLAALGVCRTHPIGVDIEAERPITEDLAGRFFAREEVEMLKWLTQPDERVRAFFRCWSRKEAVVKALGDGLSVPLTSFVVDFSEVNDAPLLVGPHGGDGRDWRILAFTPAAKVAGAIAVKAGGRPVEMRLMTPLFGAN